MTQSKSGYGIAARMAAGAALIAALPLGGCATATIEDAVPVAADAAPAADASQVPPVASAAAVPPAQRRIGANTGQFPNLNIPPEKAATQLTSADKQERLDELQAARQRQAAQGAGARPSASQAQLRKLAADHAEETLKEIEAE